jgi:hypothetical protein
MSQLDSPKSARTPGSGISDADVETPRGGFMARPGLKAPPRHAVVVRGGDAPPPEEIPVARSSFLPPPPPSEPMPLDASEKITLPAIRTPRAPRLDELAAATEVQVPTPKAVFESAPPPSDAPVVATLAERSSSVPRSRRAQRSRLTILAAALAGLSLGIVSVVTTVHVRDAAQSAPSTALAAGVEIAQASDVELKRPQPRSVASAAAAPSALPEPSATEPLAPPAAPPASPVRGATAKRTIF